MNSEEDEEYSKALATRSGTDWISLSVLSGDFLVDGIYFYHKILFYFSKFNYDYVLKIYVQTHSIIYYSEVI